MDILRIALLHLKPSLGDLARNARTVEAGVTAAASMGAEFVVTPELCLTGYDFTPSIGASWIAFPDEDSWLAHFRASAARTGVNLFFAHPERDSATGKCHNTMFALGRNGDILGRHQKINVLPGAEGWSSRGKQTAPITIGGVHVGLLVCADAYSPEPARGLAAQGANLLISSANWAPQPHGPDGCWERRGAETGLSVFVCNRTGMDRTLDFTPAETVVAHGGERLLNFQGTHSTVVRVDWDMRSNKMVRSHIHRLDIPGGLEA